MKRADLLVALAFLNQPEPPPALPLGKPHPFADMIEACTPTADVLPALVLSCAAPSVQGAPRVDTLANRPEAWGLRMGSDQEARTTLDRLVHNHNLSKGQPVVVLLPQPVKSKGLAYLSKPYANDTHQKVSPSQPEACPVDIPCAEVVIAEGWDLTRGGWGLDGEWNRENVQIIDRVSRKIIAEPQSVGPWILQESPGIVPGFFISSHFYICKYELM
jgi:hypothetical protein